MQRLARPTIESVGLQPTGVTLGSKQQLPKHFPESDTGTDQYDQRK
jgi:hypothetical protein